MHDDIRWLQFSRLIESGVTPPPAMPEEAKQKLLGRLVAMIMAVADTDETCEKIGTDLLARVRRIAK